MALTLAQIKAGYSTIPGKYNPITGKLITTPPVSVTLTPAQISAGYSTIPGPYNPVTGQLNAPTPPTPLTPPAPPVSPVAPTTRAYINQQTQQSVPIGTASPGYTAQGQPITQPTSTYTGSSIVDYLKSIGQPSDIDSRIALARQKGIRHYTGTAEQNTYLLNALRSGAAPTTPTQLTTSTTPTTPTTSTLTPEQIAAGYSTIPGPYNPVTGQPNAPSEIPVTPSTEDLGLTITTPTIPDTTANTIAYTQGLAAQVQQSRTQLENIYKKQIADLQAKQATNQAKIDELTSKEQTLLTGDIQTLLQPYREALEKSERERLKIEENYFAN